MIMGAWISTLRVPPPQNQTIGVRFGSSMCDAYQCRWTGRWFMLVPGKGEEAIAPPALWWDRTATVDDPIEPTLEAPRMRRRRGATQGQFNFGQLDSSSLSGRATEAGRKGTE